jgi:hypothetical protein
VENSPHLLSQGVHCPSTHCSGDSTSGLAGWAKGHGGLNGDGEAKEIDQILQLGIRVISSHQSVVMYFVTYTQISTIIVFGFFHTCINFMLFLISALVSPR